MASTSTTEQQQQHRTQKTRPSGCVFHVLSSLSTRQPQTYKTCPQGRVLHVHHLPNPSSSAEHPKHAHVGMFWVFSTPPLPPLTTPHIEHKKHALKGMFFVPSAFLTPSLTLSKRNTSKRAHFLYSAPLLISSTNASKRAHFSRSHSPPSNTKTSTQKPRSYGCGFRVHHQCGPPLLACFSCLACHWSFPPHHHHDRWMLAIKTMTTIKEGEGGHTRYVCKFFLFKHITNYLVPASPNPTSPCPHQHHPAPRWQQQPKYAAEYDSTHILVCIRVQQRTFLLPTPKHE